MKERIIIYQLLVRLFGNTNTNLTPKGTIEENGCGKFNDISETALRAIAELGVTHLWYTGVIEHAQITNYSKFGIAADYPQIVKGNAGSPYAIKDYYDVDPDLAERVPERMQEFDALIERTHSEGLKVIIDFVPNHVARNYNSDNNPGNFNDFGVGDNTTLPFDPQNNFYYIPGQEFKCPVSYTNGDYREIPAKATGNDHFSASPSENDWYETVKLNYGVDYLNQHKRYFDPIPKTWLMMRDILSFWAEKKVDGFRCDMAHMVPVEFWRWVIPQIKKDFPDILFIAEIYTPDLYRQYLHTGHFDYLYDKVGLYDTLRAITEGKQDAKAIPNCWKSLEGIQHRMLNFMENHDEQRIASVYFVKDPWKAVPAMTITATFNTSPVMIYCGQEVGEPASESEGFSGNDGRTTIFDYWNIPEHIKWMNKGKFDGKQLNNEQRKLRSFYEKILTLSVKEPALVKGSFYDVMWVNYNNPDINSEKIYAFFRYFNNQILLIVVNLGEFHERFRLLLPLHAWETMDIQKNSELQFSDCLLSERSFTIIPGNTETYGVTFKLNPWEACVFKVSE